MRDVDKLYDAIEHGGNVLSSGTMLNFNLQSYLRKRERNASKLSGPRLAEKLKELIESSIIQPKPKLPLPTKNPADRGLSHGQRASRQAEQVGSELAKSARKRALDSEEAALLKQLEALRRRRAEEE